MSEVSRKGKWVHGRSAHRQRSHDEAHAGAAAAPLPPVLAHALVPQGEPAIISAQHELEAHIESLRHGGRFAFDTEFIGEHSYYPQLCVIQTATTDAVAIIDPLAPGLDLRPLWTLISDASVEKIVHAGEQDLEPVWRHTGRAPANVFDTQVVAAFAGWGYPTGMVRMIRELLNADPGHGLTFSQWDRRPLSRVQTMYAANDVRYLPLLRETIAAKADALGNLSCALQECAARCAAERYRFDAASQRLRVRGVESLTPRETAILVELLAWRESAAQAADLPPRALLRDGILMTITRDPPQRAGDLARIPGLPRPVEQRSGEEIVAACRRGLAAPLPDAGRHVPLDRWSHRDKVNRLWDAAAAAAGARRIDPTLVASKRDIGHFLRGVEGGLAHAQAAGHLLEGWREALIGSVLAEHAESVAGGPQRAGGGARTIRPS